MVHYIKPTQEQIDFIEANWENHLVRHIAERLGLGNHQVSRIAKELGLSKPIRHRSNAMSPVDGIDRPTHFRRKPILNYGERMGVVLANRPGWFDEPDLRAKLLIR